MQQIGSALGLATLGTLALRYADGQISHGVLPTVAQTHGYALSFRVGAAIIDESILHRPVGGQHVMNEQLEKLEKIGTMPNVIIQVMPLTSTSQPGLEGPLRVLEFLASPPVWYTERWYSARMGETHQDVASAS